MTICSCSRLDKGPTKRDVPSRSAGVKATSVLTNTPGDSHGCMIEQTSPKSANHFGFYNYPGLLLEVTTGWLAKL